MEHPIKQLKNKSHKKNSLHINKILFRDDLNVEQFNIVNNIKGPMIVIAGAGSGKTRTITYSVAKLMENGVKPSEIMLVTFTNKAAREMLQRIKKLLGKEPKGIWGGTFHSLANRFIRNYTHLAGLKPRYTIIDQSDSNILMKLSIEEIFPNYKLMNFPSAKQCFKILSYQINTNRSIKEVLEWKYPQLLKENILTKLENLFDGYNERKRKNNLVDFNDLLVIWNRLLNEKEIAYDIAQKIKYILVDEYQDTNYIQANIILKIAQINQNIMVVGDDAQSIYSFRGADFKNLLNFGKRLKNIEQYKITYNYRSTPEILQLANDSIKNNQLQFQKIMKPVRKSLLRPKHVIVTNEKDQANFIIKEILTLRSKGINLSEIAVLYRSNFHSIILQKELQANAIPYEVRSGISFFEQAHIKDVVAHLRILLNPFDELAWNRIFKIIPNLSKISAQKIFKILTTLKDPLRELKKFINSNSQINKEKLSKQAINNMLKYFESFEKYSTNSNPYEILQKIKKLIKPHIMKNFENSNERLKDIDVLIELAHDYNLLSTFLDEFNLNMSELSTNLKGLVNKEEENNRVILSTIHKAKGLEWKIVFIISLAELLFPPSHNTKGDLDIEEERRIFYVALTRAKDEIFIITPKSTTSYKRKLYLQPSRFIEELDPSLYELLDHSDNRFELLNINSNDYVSKKNNSKNQNRHFDSEFTTADKLLKGKN
ncbi:MAG: ATP-dependent helicase [Promethearchaeota archaeon]|nr:MAG: ATP-dependent helicase [Candidatus Lokiarchaeota archaeon]